MKCPVCTSEINGLLTKCPVCGAVVDPELDSGTFPWALVYTTNTMIDAGMFKANLESAGIPVQILSQVDSTRMFTIGSLAIVKLYVPSPLLNDALEIIKAIEEDNVKNGENADTDENNEVTKNADKFND